MTKTALRQEIQRIRHELDWLLERERMYNPNWRFMATPYSKRRARLVKTYWALKALQR